MLTPEQTEGALSITRQSLAESGEPALFELLGKIGAAEDSRLVVPYLKSGPTPQRVEAVKAFGNERWGAEPLFEYLDDGELQRPIWLVLGRRGGGERAALKLLEHPPAAPEARGEWRAAISAIGARLNLEGLRSVHAVLEGNDGLQDVCESLLLAAANLAPDGTPLPPTAPPETAVEAARLEAELMLAGDYLRWREAGKARVILNRLAAGNNLGEEQRRVVALGRLRAMLQQRAYGEAAEHTATLLPAGGGTTDAALVTLWLDAADLALQQGTGEEANAILVQIETLFAGRLDDAGEARLQSLKARAPMPALFGSG